MTINPYHISKNFSQAAHQYDAHAHLQKQVVENSLSLWERVGVREASAQRNNLNFVDTSLTPPLSQRERELTLDLGCGTGYLSQLLPKQKIYQLDISENMCHLAQRKNPSICADAHTLPFANSSFSLIFSSLCLQWAINKPKTLEEIHRVLQPNAHAIISVLGTQTLQELRQAYVSAHLPSPLLNFFSIQEWSNLAQTAGLKILSQHSEIITQTHESPLALMRSLKNIGANTSSASNLGLNGRKILRKIENAYMGKQASFEVIYLVLQKCPL